MPKAKVKVQIYEAANSEWSFRVKRGSRIILVPGETYKTRTNVRRALKRLSSISDSQRLDPTELEDACNAELIREQAAWDARPKVKRGGPK